MRDRIAALARTSMRGLQEWAGGRQVVRIHPEVRGGNILYLWQEMFLRDQRGVRAVVTTTPAMEPRLEEFPLLRALSVDSSSVTWLDRQLFMYPRRYGVDFSAGDNRRFCRALVASSPTFQARRRSLRRTVTQNTCVINVRRGDYYSVPEHEQRYGLDIERHVSQALALITRAGRQAKDVVVISDDVQWCREHLGSRLSGLRTLEQRRDMFDDLAALSCAHTLVLANSTFSYWGAFLAEAFASEAMVIAPPFHERGEGASLSDHELAPHWARTSMGGLTEERSDSARDNG